MKNLNHVKSLSELVELAVNDMAIIKKDKRYTFDVNQWHAPNGNTCAVCVAGCVMANTIGYDINQDYELQQFDSRDTVLIWAIDNLRRGYIFKVCSRLSALDIEVGLHELQDCYNEINKTNLLSGHLTTWRKFLRLVKSKGL